jgi:glycerophosphoryl diester phosphodiesterase
MFASLLLTCCALATAAADDADLKLIAHRGGVVDQQHIENNLPGIKEAIRRGYGMLEVDIRESKDGHLVVQHDADFRRFYGDERRVADMTWEEISKLRSTPGDLRPLEFAEYAAACQGKIRLMLDIKEPEHSQAFFASLISTLQENDLLDSAYIIGTDQSRKLLADRAKVGINPRKLVDHIAGGEDVGKRYFLFAHAKDFDQEVIELARSRGVVVVPSINTFHYPAKTNLQDAAADIMRLKQLGVTHFQIDSVYEPFCRD